MKKSFTFVKIVMNYGFLNYHFGLCENVSLTSFKSISHFHQRKNLELGVKEKLGHFLFGIFKTFPFFELSRKKQLL